MLGELSYTENLKNFYKSARCFKNADNFLIRNAGKFQRINEYSIKQIISMNLWSTEFMPKRRLVRGSDGTMYAAGLIQSRQE